MPVATGKMGVATRPKAVASRQNLVAGRKSPSQVVGRASQVVGTPSQVAGWASQVVRWPSQVAFRRRNPPASGRRLEIRLFHPFARRAQRNFAGAERGLARCSSVVARMISTEISE